MNISRAPGRSHAKKRSVLVVDDERISVKVISKMVEDEGHKALPATSGKEALELVASNGIDLLLTDLLMPEMSGIELIERVRKINPELDIIVITGLKNMETFIEAIRVGAGDFIVKPFDKTQFSHAISRSLERTTLKERLAERTQQLVHAEKMSTVGQLATGIAHEINNPTTYVRTNLQLINEYVKRLGPKLDSLDDEKNLSMLKNVLTNEFPQITAEAIEGTERIQKVVKGINLYSQKVKSAGAQNVDIRNVITEALGLVRNKLLEHVSITENYLDIREIKGDFGNFQQVFVNLLTNSADAIGERVKALRSERKNGFKGLVDVSATVIEGNGSGDPDYLTITIYDNGCGMPPEIIKKVFDPFFSNKEFGTGIGLGLYICHEIVNKHGGDILIESEQDEGTSVIINLPVN